MEQAWVGDTDLAKLSINSLIGLRATDEHYVYSCKTSRRKEEGIGAHATHFAELAD